MPWYDLKPGLPKLRKQCYELTAANLNRYTVWEFALDEEGEPGQDEATVRPRPDWTKIRRRAPMMLVRAEFTAADGSPFVGYFSPSSKNDLGILQPTIVHSAGQASFWHGIVKPKTANIEAVYRALGKTRTTLFPLSFSSSVPCTPGVVGHGVVEGHYYYPDSRTMVPNILT